MQAVVDVRRPTRQDTFDLREQIQQDDHAHLHAHADAASATYTDDEEHSVLEDDSDGEDHEDYADDMDDGSSSLSIPNESIDFDLVYSLHSFAATVEGQANVVKGDSLFLMDDSNSYWWLVRVLKTQEVGYIPAENIETPFERLARLNKHRNVDLASATQAEMNENFNDRVRNNLSSRTGSNRPSSPYSRGAGAQSQQSRGVHFTSAFSVRRYPPAIWKEDEEDDPNIEWEEGEYDDEDLELAEEQMEQRRTEDEGPDGMEPDDGMVWEDAAVEDIQVRQLHAQGSLAAVSAQAENNAREVQLQRQRQEQAVQQQQQRDLVEQQKQQQQQQQAPAAQVQILRSSGSRERLVSPQDDSRTIDPLQATETRKLTATPTVARDPDESLQGTVTENHNQREEERAKRLREEELSEEARKRAKGKEKMGAPVSSDSLVAKVTNGGGKLRKDPRGESEDENGKEKKKKGSMFGGLFRKKDKNKDKNSSIGSLDSGDLVGRVSEESSRSGHTRPSAVESVLSPTTATAMQQQQQQALNLRNSNESKRSGQSPQQQQPHPQPPQPQPQPQSQLQPPSQLQPHTPERAAPSVQVSPHALQLRQRDQQQQALYQQQYLNRSPSSPPEVQLSAIAGHHAYQNISGSGTGLGPPVSRPRPGSLIMDGHGPGANVPELSVIRVFAGKNLETEATFKTVLLNSSTTSAELIRQATQRFRLSAAGVGVGGGAGGAGAGGDESEYYLTVKQVEGGASAVLRPDENPLVVFEHLVVEAMELPKVKRSSVGSISSVASNLSMHPAIKKLPMNDFTDDSAVKFYLNKRGGGGGGGDVRDDSVMGHVDDDDVDVDADETLIANSSFSGESDAPTPKQHYLTVSTSHNVTPERFTSPSFRFPLQLVIYPDDLPDDMVFHPLTEAIVFKDTLRGADATLAPTVSPTLRRKVFVFPKNVTVAEVIEIGLERFGISEGVVDGGDEVEDKLNKRRSSSRVRYGLFISAGSHERELAPSSRVIEAFPKPPTFRATERPANKRRSVDSTLILGTLDDVNPDDPVFILRRAISYRNSTSRHRVSAPLDEIALQQLHRDSASSISSSDPTSPLRESSLHLHHHHHHHHHKQPPSRQEIIARQREATRANQRAILSAQTNSVRGMDVLLPGNAMLRSSRYDVNDRMRYSYVEPDGETYDISDIVEEELRETNSVNRNDLLESVLGRKDLVGEKLNRVLSKIKSGKSSKEKDGLLARSFSVNSSRRSGSVSEYSFDDAAAAAAAVVVVGADHHHQHKLGARSTSPLGPSLLKSRTPVELTQTQARSSPPVDSEERHSRTGSTTPTGKPTNHRHPSIASVMSDVSNPTTPLANEGPTDESSRSASTTKTQQRRPFLPTDDFGVAHMLTMIEYTGAPSKVSSSLPALDPVDAMLFGRPVDIQSLHPQIRDIYAPIFKQFEEMDKILDDYLGQAIASH